MKLVRHLVRASYPGFVIVATVSAPMLFVLALALSIGTAVKHFRWQLRECWDDMKEVVFRSPASWRKEFGKGTAKDAR